MKFSAILILSLASAATANLLSKGSSTGKCGPQTQVCIADNKDAAGKPEWDCTAAVDGAMVRVSKEQQYGALVCGPGTFHFSPMQCAGDKFEYKKQSTDISTSAWTGGVNCNEGVAKKVDFVNEVACYSVAC